MNLLTNYFSTGLNWESINPVKTPKSFLVLLTLLCLTFCLPSIQAQDPGDCEVDGGMITPSTGMVYNRVVVANRASGTISVINSDNNEVEHTYPMPDDGEPMYVVYNKYNNTVLVGDYNGKVVAFDGKDFSVVGSATAGAGVFHMWISPDNQQLWVNNELDKTVSVINPNTLETLATIPLSADLEADGFKQHDVIIMPDNSAAFVTFLGPLEEDYVIKYDATTFDEVARAAVGLDPHVSLTGANGVLYVACQGSDVVQVLNRSDLSQDTTLAVPNAHGLGMNQAGTYLYVGNISEGGTNATYTIDLATNAIMEPVDAPFAVPHNYAVTYDDSQLFVTHSGGTSDQVSIYTLDPTPTLITSVTVENNPFGLAAYTYVETEVAICVDGTPDPIDVAVSGASGTNGGWIITDTDNNILGLPAAPPFDLDGAGPGTCVIWYIRYEDGLTGKEVGNNVSDLEGCYDLSNGITVTREICDNMSFTLVDADRDMDLGPLMHGDVVYPTDLGVSGPERLNVRVDLEGDIPGSVVFSLNDVAEFNIEQVVPYALGGDNNGDYHPTGSALGYGEHTLTATPYSSYQGMGTAGDAVSVSFTIKEGSANERRAFFSDFSIYPNPVSNDINIVMPNGRTGNTQIYIFNQLGEVVLIDEFKTVSSNWNRKLNVDKLPTGMYIIQVQNGDIQRSTRFVKN